MNIIFVLIPLGLVLLGVAIWAFLWAVGSGQFDDLDSPAYRILSDDDEPPAGGGSGDAGNAAGDDRSDRQR